MYNFVGTIFGANYGLDLFSESSIAARVFFSRKEVQDGGGGGGAIKKRRDELSEFGYGFVILLG